MSIIMTVCQVRGQRSTFAVHRGGVGGVGGRQGCCIPEAGSERPGENDQAASRNIDGASTADIS